MTTAFDASFSECVVASREFSVRSRVSFSSVAESSGGFCVRRTPRACHGGCDRLRPGSLRASHAVCLAARTLEPVFCARKEGADIESASTTASIFEESLVMQRDLSDSRSFIRILRHEPALHSTSLASEFQFGETANNGAAENCSARHGSCYSRSWPSRAVVALLHVRCRLLRSTLAATAPRSAVSELESLGVASPPE